METKSANGIEFQWVDYFMEFSDRLRQYKAARPALLKLLSDAFIELGIKNPFYDHEELLDDICPFTVFGCFNKGLTDDNRRKIMGAIGKRIGVRLAVPTKFDGVPLLNNMRAWFFGYKTARDPADIMNLWLLFEAALDYADRPDDNTTATFSDLYNRVRRQAGIKWNLSIGLYWIRPLAFINLDNRNRSFLEQHVSQFLNDGKNILSFGRVPEAEEYLKLITRCKAAFEEGRMGLTNFPALSHAAWQWSNEKGIGDDEESGKAVQPENNVTQGGDVRRQEKPSAEARYWLYAPGEGSRFWDEFYEKGIMGLGWDDMGDLKQYSSKDAMKARMKQIYGAEYTYMNAAHATWQFTNDIKSGDVVYAKRGRLWLIGRGIVTSDYRYDPSRKEYTHVRSVRWTHRGQWEHPGQAALKTLTDVTDYTDYVRKLEDLFLGEEEAEEVLEAPVVTYASYIREDFLREVYMEPDRYDTLVRLLLAKKNVILQGSPGVGKTFAAERLAFSIMGERDRSRVHTVQFHQSYSYEDFMIGYRPTETGFVLKTGPFYDFCKDAQVDSERDYFFLIDEINRGNLSKIMGELLTLMECGRRGEPVRLLYDGQIFSVPPNVYIIGMMNTADRSLAMMDYALRRRFGFFELQPAFGSEGFREMLKRSGNPKHTVLAHQVEALNEAIATDAALGPGFRIGHSYLCHEGLATNAWLREVVEFELVPLLWEYWFDERDKVEQWTKALMEALS